MGIFFFQYDSSQTVPHILCTPRRKTAKGGLKETEIQQNSYSAAKERKTLRPTLLGEGI